MSKRIAALGDSTSCGEGVGLRVPVTGTWPARLAAATPGGELVPLARPGARLQDLRRDQLPAALDSGADVVTLLIGLNDVSRSGFDRDRFAQDLADTVRALCSTGALVLVGRLHDPTVVLPLPQGVRALVRARTAAVNAAVDGCVSDRVRLLDLARLHGLRIRRAWDVDRLHPNAAGHALIAEAAARVLRSAGCCIGPIRQAPLPPAPSRLRETQWLLLHGMPWVSRQLPQIGLATVGAALRLGSTAGR